MSFVPSPPRGLSDCNIGARLATARWGTSKEAAAHAYQPGDIFLGTIPVPTPEAEDALAELDAFRALLLEDRALDEAWKAAQLGTIGNHAALLARTSLLAIGTGDDRHLITEAGTRSGKGTSCIVPALCLFPGSALVLDPKGENARLTATRRGAGSAYCQGMGQEVVILDPYNTSRRPPGMRASWNPLDLLALDDLEMVDKAASIAEAMMIRAKGADAHFDESALGFIKGLILFVVVLNDTDTEDAPPRNLLSVYDLLMRGAHADLNPDRVNPQPSDALMLLLFQMMEVNALDGIVAGAASALLDMGDKERGSVLSTARRNLAFLERPAMRAVLKDSSFNLDHIKTAPEGLTLYLCLPQQRMESCGRWLRLMITAALERVYAIEEEPATGHPILFLLEEFASLGHMAAIETAAGYAAGFGIKLWVIIQDLSQLKRHYNEGWETFVGNAGTIQAFGNSDVTTLEYLSKKLGEVEVTQRVQSVTTSLTAASNDPGDGSRMQSLLQNRGALSFINPFSLAFDDSGTSQSASTTTANNEQVSRAPLMLPDEIERFFRREALAQLVCLKGLPPLILERVDYHDSPLFVGLYETRPKDIKLTLAEAAKLRDRDSRQRQESARDVISEALRFVRGNRKAVEAAKIEAVKRKGR